MTHVCISFVYVCLRYVGHCWWMVRKSPFTLNHCNCCNKVVQRYRYPTNEFIPRKLSLSRPQIPKIIPFYSIPPFFKRGFQHNIYIIYHNLWMFCELWARNILARSPGTRRRCFAHRKSSMTSASASISDSFRTGPSQVAAREGLKPSTWP